MTAALVVSRPANMPGYNSTADLEEVHGLPSDYSYSQPPMVSSTPGMFSLSQTEPSADLLNGSSWGTSEGPQNFQDFPDNGSSHSGEAEEYIFTSGHTTPRGSRRDHSQATETAWTASRTAPAVAGGQAMSRASSSRSNGSSLSQRSQMSNLDIRGNASAFRTGSQAASSMVGMDSCLLLDSDAAAMPSQMYWPEYTVDMGLNADTAFSLPAPLHVVPAQMQLGPDAVVPDNSSPGSWDCFSSSISRTSSPASVDEAWLSGPMSPHSSPDIQCQSPRYVQDCSDNVEPASYQLDVFSSDRKFPLTTDYLNGQEMPQLDDTITLTPTFVPRRPGYEGESARDHELYKNAAPRPDGMYHCPWEGQASCNHKPEKLKCNYDKFVDSHLKPYRCKAESCEGARFSSTACLLRHEREAHGLHGHGDKPFLCHHEGCDRSQPGNGFPRQWNLRDHMKRVHNDRGSAGGSPPSAAPVQAPAKGRKRKPDVPETHATSSRKASLKSMPQAESKPVPGKPLIDQWLDHHQEVQNMLRGIEKPDGARTVQQIAEVQRRLETMARMTADMANMTKGTTTLPATGRGNYVSTG